jgi:hypothetical protein
MTGALIVQMVGEYHGTEFIAYIQNPLLGWVYLVASLTFTGISIYLAYRVFGVEQPVIDNRGFDL